MAEEYGKVKKSTMTAIADAIRAKKDTTAIFTPAQMVAEIEGIVTGDDLPNAEDATFGTGETKPTEYGISSYAKIERYDPNYNRQSFLRFTVNETIAIHGFRAYLLSGYSNTNTVKLWNSAQEQIASVSISIGGEGWQNDVMLGTPINLFAGETYYLSTYGKGSCVASGVTLNSKIKGTGIFTGTASSATTWPSSFTSFSSSLYGVPDMIIGLPITESVPEYKIQTGTMAQIADEVIRFTGATTKLSTAQIITALQGIAVQTTE